MKSLKAGAILLSVWSGLNLLAAIAVTVLTVSHHTPPALSMLFTNDDVLRLDGRVLAVVDAQAALGNPSIAAVCILVLALVWRGVMASARWAWWALACALIPLQVFARLCRSRPRCPSDTAII